ncbi:GMC oxidoreductase [Thozetella sp. PMI_491]|nr:GMC oxidoreductase [Thozetella sp. PMI_491]
MGLYKTLPEHVTEVDVIVAGGGVGGCIVAGRLAETDPELSILVIEGGMNNYNLDNVIHPALFLEHLASNSKDVIVYKGNKAAQLAGRSLAVQTGGMLGGGSSVNFTMYNRAQASDFDSWKTSGWSADDMRPFLKKLESYHGTGIAASHGFDVPVQVSSGRYRVTKIEDDFIAAAAEVGYPEIRDLNDLDSNNGVSRAWPRTVSLDGYRQDAATTYLHPRLQDGKHPNLHVLVETKVLRVLFDGTHATGVEFVANPDFVLQTELNSSAKQTVRARKLVVVSCGTCSTPAVLERSGIGSPKVLANAGIPVVVDLPGVGENYQDHNLVMIPYKTNLAPHETIDALFNGNLNREQAIATNSDILSWNSIDAAGKIRLRETEVASLGPEFQAAWDRDYKDNPNRPLMLIALLAMYTGDPTAVPRGQYVSFADYTAYPYSRGRMHITGPEITDEIDFDVGFFTDANDIDLKKQVWAYKKGREIVRRTKLYRGEVPSGHPVFSANSKAALWEGPFIGPITDIEYSAEDDIAIEKFLREHIETTWHSLGTVKMAPREKIGCVDCALNVYGVQGLKVVDLSIAPENVAANTNNTAMAIGEKGADIILRELGYSARG